MNQEIIKIEGLNGPKSSIIGNVLLGLTGTTTMTILKAYLIIKFQEL